MPKFRRLVVPGYPHHVTQRGVRRQTTFFDPTDYKAYICLAAELLTESNLDFYAYCLMPNHIHAVVVPYDEKALSRYFATLHRRYARRTNALHGWKGHLWQERFYSVAMPAAHAMSALRYVELNPVRSGLVRHPENWSWSSAKGNLEMTKDPLVNRKQVRQVVEDWQAYLDRDVSPAELQRVRNQTRTGRPAGNDQFIKELEARTGRKVGRNRRGTKPKAG